LCNSIANGDGFSQGMLFAGSRFHLTARWTNGAVYDTDFVDPEINAQGKDVAYFDHAGTAISYFTGHGITTDGCHPDKPCTTTSACKTFDPNAGESMPGSCRFSPMDKPRCCYMVDRNLVTHSPFDKFRGYLNYSNGPIRWGESPQSGGWAGAGTNGGANLVVLDISHGILPPFWYQTLQNANAGVQMIATMMTAGGDTANVADRGATFATFYRQNENNKVSTSWLDTMPALPANEGQSCPDVGLGAGGFHGFNGCGCNIITAMDSTVKRAQQAMNESWVTLANDSNDALGNQAMWVLWHCNYPFRSTDQRAWELP
jgi:hypothetical protein